MNSLEYPNAFNPSLIPYKDGYLLSFRVRDKFSKKERNNNLRVDSSLIGLAKMNKQFKVSEKSIQFLNIQSYDALFSLTAEDARLFPMGDRIYIIFNDLPLLASSNGYAMYLGELVEKGKPFVFKEPAKPLNYPSAIHVEKNWSPFVSGNKIYLIYSDQPRIILEVDLNSGNCQQVVGSNLDCGWNLGKIRGGTPAYLVNDNAFLTIFHSVLLERNSNNEIINLNYVMGAYTFDKNFPFFIQKIMPGALGDRTYYVEDNSKKVVFPGGLVIEDRLIHVSWGKNDKNIFITTFDKEKLLALMKPAKEF